MSEHTKEPWSVKMITHPQRLVKGDICLIAEPHGPVIAFIRRESINDNSTINARRIVACVNALDGFLNPEADVQALVNVLNACRGYFETTAEVEGQEGQIMMRDMVNAALSRLRREP